MWRRCSQAVRSLEHGSERRGCDARIARECGFRLALRDGDGRRVEASYGLSSIVSDAHDERDLYGLYFYETCLSIDTP